MRLSRPAAAQKTDLAYAARLRHHGIASLLLIGVHKKIMVLMVVVMLALIGDDHAMVISYD